MHGKAGSRVASQRAVFEILEPRLLLNADISGTVWQDLNGNGAYDGNEGVAGVTVFMDDDRDGLLDDAERDVVTDADGRYVFADTPAGNYNICTLAKGEGWETLAVDRLIGLGSRSGPIRRYQGDWPSILGPIDNYDPDAALWEIDPETGHMFNHVPIEPGEAWTELWELPGGVFFPMLGFIDTGDVNYCGLAAVPGEPGLYMSANQTVGSGVWNDEDLEVVSIEWHPGQDLAVARYVNKLDPYDGWHVNGPAGVDFDPLSKLLLLYGGAATEGGAMDDPCDLWVYDVATGQTYALGSHSSYPVNDFVFDANGNLYTFSHDRDPFTHQDYPSLLRLDKYTGDVLEEIRLDAYAYGVMNGAEFDPDSGLLWSFAERLYEVNQYSGAVQAVGPAYDFYQDFGYRAGDGWGESLIYCIEGLELLEDAFFDRPVTLRDTYVQGIDFQHDYHLADVSGRVVRDLNTDGRIQDFERPWGIGGKRVFLDDPVNPNGRWDDGEPYTWTDPNGSYTFAGLQPGDYIVALGKAPGQDTTYPFERSWGHHAVHLAEGEQLVRDFAVAWAVDVSGMAWDDVNLDGLPGEGETPLAGVKVYVDQDENGVLNELPVIGQAAPNAAIPDDGSPLTSTITIVGVEAPVADVDVYLQITHPSAEDLHVYLVGPRGTRVELFYHVGADLADFDVTLSDEAGESIVDTQGPGTFRPTGDLADFDGELPYGEWTLEVHDDLTGQTGTLDFWSLRVTVGDIVAVTGADGTYEFRHLPPGPMSIRQELTHLRSPTSPSPAGEVLIEGFEEVIGNHYTQVESGDPASRSGDAAYNSGMGLRPGRWILGHELAPVVQPGDTISWHVRFPAVGTGGWLLLGFGATDEGTLAVALNPGTTTLPAQIQLMHVSTVDGYEDFEFSILGAKEFGPAADTWYRAEVDWDPAGTLTARVFPADGQPAEMFELVAPCPWSVGSGTLAFRCVGTEAHVDEVSVRHNGDRRVLAPFGSLGHLDFGSAADGVIQGAVFADENFNGVNDAEPALPGWQVYDDANNDGQFDADIPTAPLGDVTVRPINDRAVAVAEIPVPSGVGRVRDVNVYMDLDHDAVGDLTVWLVSPAGTRVLLFDHVSPPVAGAFEPTTFDDQAATAAGDGVAFTGTLRPQGSLSQVFGENAGGVWHVVVLDDAPNGAEGALNYAILDLASGDLDVRTDALGLYIGGVPAGQYHLRQEHRAEFYEVVPDDGVHELTLGSGEIRLAVDFGNFYGEPLPELMGVELLVLDEPVPGSGVAEVRFAVRNDGLLDSPAFEVALYLSEDAYISAADTHLTTVPMAALSVDSTVVQPVTVNLPVPDPFLTDNEYWVGMIVDPTDDVPELREYNNANRNPINLDRAPVGSEVHLPSPADGQSDLAETLPLGTPVNAAIGDDEWIGGADVDIYALPVEQGGWIGVDLDRTSGDLDAVLRLYGPWWTLAATVDDAPAPGETLGSDPYLEFYAIGKTVYYVTIAAAGNEPADPRLLTGRSIAATSGTYTLTAAATAGPQADVSLEDHLSIAPAILQPGDALTSLEYQIGNAGPAAVADGRYALEVYLSDGPEASPEVTVGRNVLELSLPAPGSQPRAADPDDLSALRVPPGTVPGRYWPVAHLRPDPAALPGQYFEDPNDTDNWFVGATPVVVDDAYEENDAPGSAWYPGASWADAWLSGFDGVACAADADYYSIVVPADHLRLTAELAFRRADGDMHLEVRESDGTLVATADADPNGELLEVFLPHSGPYLLKVTLAGAPGNTYDLRWSALSSVLPDLVGAECVITNPPGDWGRTLGADWAVRNDGPAAAGAFDVGFYLSQDPALDGGDVLLGSVSIPSQGAGQLIDLPINRPLPDVPPAGWPASGTFYLLMVVDSNNDVDELNEANNHGLGEHLDWDTFAVSATVDLADRGYSYSSFSPATIVPGNAWQAHWDIINYGTGPTGAFVVRFYASTDDEITAADYLLGSTTVAGVAPGAWAGADLNLASFPAIPADSYYVGVIIDADNDVPESVESNNTGDRYGLRVVTGPPDLLGVGLDVPAGATDWGQGVRIDYRIANQGEGNAGAFFVEFYLSRDTVISGDDVLLESPGGMRLSVWELAVGDTLESAWQVDLPGAPPPGWPTQGTFYVLMDVDADDDALESNEANNSGRGMGLDADSVQIVQGLNVWMQDAWVTCAADGDGDGYCSDLTVHWNADTSAASLDVYVQIQAIGSDGLLEAFWFTDAYTIYGEQADDQGFRIADALPHDEYDFNMYLYSGGTIWDLYHWVNDADIRDVPAELASEEILLANLADRGDAFSGTQHPVVTAGLPWECSWQVANTGPGEAGSFFVSFYLSTDPQITEQDIPLGSAGVSSLPAGGYADTDLALSSFPAAALGQYYVGAIIDPGDQVVESNESDNVCVDLDGYPLTVAGAGDANLDGIVDGGDYTLWADHYTQPGSWGEGDFNQDGFVEGGDYTIWADNYQAPLPGDANDDGFVDGGDYTLWADHYMQPGSWGEGDFNQDGFVDGGDYTIWADNYGDTLGGLAGQAAFTAQSVSTPTERAAAGLPPAALSVSGAGSGAGIVTAGAGFGARSSPAWRSRTSAVRRQFSLEAGIDLLAGPDLAVLARPV